MEDKQKEKQENSVLLAKRNIVDSIWKSANLEGIAVTFPETEMIFDGMVAKNMYLKDVNAIINLKKAWEFIIEYVDYSIDLEYIFNINKIIGAENVTPKAGYIRTNDVQMGGTKWKPEIPDEEKIKNELNNIKKIENPIEQATTLMLYLMRSQIFYDGNKRTALISANQVMLNKGAGIISIPIEEQTNFRNELINFYETNDMKKIQELIKSKCITEPNFQIKETNNLEEFEQKLKMYKKSRTRINEGNER